MLSGLRGINLKALFRKVLSLFPVAIRVKLLGFYHLGYWFDLDNPKTFNEKINKRKLENVNDRFVLCSDKAKSRDYVRSLIGEEYLIPVIYIGDTLTSQQLKDYGDNIVVKATHNSGYVFIVNGESVDYSSITESVLKSFNSDFGKKTDELWYSKIKPQVIVEKLLIKEDGSQPEDYKFHVFNSNGNIKIILQVDYDRFTNHNRTFYDDSLNILDFSIKYKNNKRMLLRPKNFELMLELVKKLSVDFDYVRVDLYNVDGEIYFGELTFAHESGFGKFDSLASDKLLGSYWK